jgi:hypothetical protein
MKWQESPASKTKLSQYAQDVFGSWDLVWDQSNNNAVEFVARKGTQVCYVKYSPSFLEKLPESKRAKELAWRIDFFDEVADFRSFAEVKNDNRLRKLGL